jgi:hypothetical protein
MEQLNLFVAVAVVIGIIGASGAVAFSVGHSKGLQAGIESGSKVVETAFNNPIYLQLAKGASENIPQQAFNKYLAISAAAQTWTPDWVDVVLQRIDDVIKKIDHDPANDPAAPPKPPEQPSEGIGIA